MAIHIELKVMPQSGKQGFLYDKNGTLKCFLKSPPEGGKANSELIKFISNALGVPQENIMIVQGATARKKRISIRTAMSQTTVLEKLGLEIQQKI